MRAALDRLRSRLLDQRGYSVVELVTVCAILAIVLGGLTTVFVSASKAELEQNRRFEAQQNARLALDKLRREGHCASSLTISTTPSGQRLTFTLPSQCVTGSGAVSWCTVGSGSRYALYRQAGSSCGSALPAVMWADYLTKPSGLVFTYVLQSPAALARLEVELPVDVQPSSPIGKYTLSDHIALRNSTRT